MTFFYTNFLYVFQTSKNNSIKQKTWYDIVEEYRIEAGIQQKIGTHGLRKTFGRRYYMAADNKWDALIQLERIFRHGSPEITLVYICVTDQEIYDNIISYIYIFPIFKKELPPSLNCSFKIIIVY